MMVNMGRNEWDAQQHMGQNLASDNGGVGSGMDKKASYHSYPYIVVQNHIGRRSKTGMLSKGAG